MLSLNLAGHRLPYLPLFLALALACLIRNVCADAPPSWLVIKYPTSPVQLGDDVVIGYYTVNDSLAVNLVRSVVISVTYPNGTNTEILDNSASYGALSAGDQAGVVNADQVGSYTSYWNVTYDLLTFANTSGVETSVSSQNWVLSASFSVVRGSGAASTTPAPEAPAGTSTLTFASPATGVVSWYGTATGPVSGPPSPSATKTAGSGRTVAAGLGGLGALCVVAALVAGLDVLNF